MTRNEQPGFDPTLYDADFFVWTQRQAAALRAMPRDSAVDLKHVAEEIEDLGKRDLREVVSYLERLLEHLIKLDACPDSRDRAHWKREATQFQRAAAAAFSPGMRRLLVEERLWTGGCKLASYFVEDGGAGYEAPLSCPLPLDDLLSDGFDIDAALARLGAAHDTPRP